MKGDDIMLKNIVARERRRILVTKKDIGDIFEIVYEMGLQLDGHVNLAIGNCGWQKAPDCYYVLVTLNDKYYNIFLKNIKERNIELLPETIRY